jgi:hypothetical protein
MEQLIELLQQIQDLAGTAIEALQGASAEAGGEAPEGAPAEGGAPPEGGPPPA